MADSASAVSSSLADAVHWEVEQRLALNKDVQWVRQEATAVRQATSKGASIGWKLKLGPDYLGIDRTLLLYIPETFPNDPPRAHISPTAYQQWPHAEPSGCLCLWRDGEPPDCSMPAPLVDDFFSRIGQLLELVRPDSDPERRRLEFQGEWLSYWLPPSGKKIASLHNFLITAPLGKITALYNQTLIRAGTERNDKGRMRTPAGFWRELSLYSADVETLKQWGTDFVEVNRIPDAPEALYIPLLKITSPSMPESVPALRAWVQDCGGIEALFALDQALEAMKSNGSRLSLIFGLQTENGTALAGLVVKLKERSAGPSRRHGRRRGRQASLYIWVIRALKVSRADRGWARDRCVDRSSGTLEKKHVVLVGCGMLGSPIAESLARAGVGRLTIIDSDEFDAANIGRHVLGASYLGQGKAEALAHHIRSSIPATEVKPIYEDVVTQGKCKLFGADIDLVICTTADWRCERFIIAERHRHATPTALMVCWLEPYALAGHALLSTSASDPLMHMFSPAGEFLNPCVIWPNGRPAHRLPACQATFQPAGMAAALPVISMCTSAALDHLLHRSAGGTHFSWCAHPRTVEAVNGLVSTNRQTWPCTVHQQPLTS